MSTIQNRFDLKKNGKNLAQTIFLCVSVLSVKNVPFDMGQDLSPRWLAGIIGGYIKAAAAAAKKKLQENFQRDFVWW